MDGECCICLDSLFGMEDPKQKQKPKLATMAGCGHIFHEECLIQCFKKLEVTRPLYPMQQPPLATKNYKSHPTCPKCRATARPCRYGNCRAYYADDYYGDHAEQRFRCTPYVALFMNDTDTGGLVKPKDANIGILMVKNKAGGKEKYNLAQEVRSLGLDMQTVKDEVSELLQIDLEHGEPLLGREHTIKVKNVKTKIENLLSTLKYKNTDVTLKAVTKDLTKVIDDLGKELDSDKTIGTLRERIDGFDLELETNVNAAMDDLREEHDEEMDDLRLELEGLQDILIQRAIELREASDKVKRREKTIIEHEKTIKKLTVKQKKAESEIESAERMKLKKSQDIAEWKKKYTDLETVFAGLKSAHTELKRQGKGSEKQQAAAEAFAAKAQAYADSLRGNKTPPKVKSKTNAIDLSTAEERPAKRAKIERETTPVSSNVSTAVSTPVKSHEQASGRGHRQLSANASAEFSRQIEQLVKAEPKSRKNGESSGRFAKSSRFTRSATTKRKSYAEDDDDDYDPSSE